MVVTWHIKKLSIVCIRVSPPPQKHPSPPISCQASLKLANCPSSLFLGNRPITLVFRELPPPVPPSPKSWIFQWIPKIFKFSSLIPSFLLKVTKFLGKISQFEFLVITEKKCFCLKTFFVIKYFRFSFIFYVKIATPLPKIIHPLFPSNPL